MPLRTPARESSSACFRGGLAMEVPEILSIRDLHKHFPVTGGVFQRETGRMNVLNGVSFSVGEGEIFGLVGESGCGKTTLARLLVKLLEPSAGEILLSGHPLSAIGRRERRDFYREVQMIFQDPYSSLNPRLRVRSIIGEMVRIRGASRADADREALGMLQDVGLGEQALGRYPFELSGGQRQRVAIARALVVRPGLLIADEPVSALDLSIQSQILDLLKSLKARYNLTILFISHDLTTVAGFCDRVAVMYLGRIVEVLEASRLFSDGRHPYLKALLDSVPIPDPSMRRKERRIIPGEVPSPLALPSGCPFHPRCPIRIGRCATECPPLTARGDDGHRAACHCV